MIGYALVLALYPAAAVYFWVTFPRTPEAT